MDYMNKPVNVGRMKAPDGSAYGTEKFGDSLVKGRHIQHAMEISPGDIIDELDELPDENILSLCED